MRKLTYSIGIAERGRTAVRIRRTKIDVIRSAVHSFGTLSPEVDVYRDGVDRTLLRENLKLTAQERMEKHQRARRTAEELRRAGRRMRSARAPAR